MSDKKVKVKKKHYFCIDGKLKAVEIHDDDSIKVVHIQDEIVNYSLNGGEVKSK